MNILAIADLFVTANAMRDALSELKPSRLKIVDWVTRDRTELHQRIRRIESRGPDSEAPPESIWDYLDDVELIITHMCPIGAALIHRAAALRMIGVCRAGTENVNGHAAADRGVRVFNVPGRNTVAVAEFTVGLILTERRNIARAHLSITKGDWRKAFANADQFTELSKKTVGLIGFGRIGQTVAKYLRPFDVDLLVHDPIVSAETTKSHAGQLVSLDELLRRSDIVSLHARRDEDDPPLIGAPELTLMKPSAYLINTARAYLLDTNALIAALRANQIAGAALDVFEDEPIDADSPLRCLDNITLTPHLAGSTREAFYNSPRMLVETIQREMR